LDEADHWLSLILHMPGRRLFAATQGLARYQVPVLQALGLWPLFSGILAPDTTGYGKGEDGFYAPVRRSGDLLLSVGDRYDDDVVAPARCGVLPIWKVSQDLRDGDDPFTRAQTIPLPPGESIRPVAVIGHLRELPQVINALEGDLPHTHA
jgi:FMN phosphatase YigB (HAD superfamily)